MGSTGLVVVVAVVVVDVVAAVVTEYYYGSSSSSSSTVQYGGPDFTWVCHGRRPRPPFARQSGAQASQLFQQYIFLQRIQAFLEVERGERGLGTGVRAYSSRQRSD